MKQHLFVNEHIVEISQGVFVKGRFATFEHIADWWNQIKAGNMNKAEDLRKLIAHEYIESKLMQQGMLYRRADLPVSPSNFSAHDISIHDSEFHFNVWQTTIKRVPPTQLNDNLSNIDQVVQEILTKSGY